MIDSPIRIHRLKKSFGRRKILQDLSFELEPGRITGIAGPNACGKTTLIKSILGLVIPDSGEILVHGKSVRENEEYRRALGYVPQIPELPPNLAVFELLKMLEDLRCEAAPRKSELIDFFELSPFLEQPFGQLSGGTKQKVAATLALMFDAPLLVLDEPTASLDPVSTVRLKDLLRDEAERGKTILLVSHAMTELDQLAANLIYLMDGKIAFHGPIEHLKRLEKEASLERAITGLVLRKHA